MPGFGHRQHSADPRSARLLGLAGELGLSRNYVAHAQSMDRVLSEIAGKSVPLNADGAIAALLCEDCFSQGGREQNLMMARVPGPAVAHCLEEQGEILLSRPIDPAGCGLDGPAERSPRQADKTQDSAIENQGNAIVSRFDLVGKNGTLVIPYTGLIQADLGVKDGRISAIDENIAAHQGETASRLAARWFFREPWILVVISASIVPFSEDAESESRSSLVGGVTTMSSYSEPVIIT